MPLAPEGLFDVPLCPTPSVRKPVQRCNDKHQPGLDCDSASDIRYFLTWAFSASALMPRLIVVIAWCQPSMILSDQCTALQRIDCFVAINPTVITLSCLVTTSQHS